MTSLPRSSNPARNGAARPVVLATPGVEPSGSKVAVSLAAHGLLRRWITPFAVRHATDPGSLSSLFLRRSELLSRLLSARTIPPALGDLVELYPLRELVRIAANRAGLADLTRHRLWQWAETAFDRHVARTWAGQAPCLYGFEQASLESFRAQKAAGGLCVLWQVIAHHRTLQQVLRDQLEAFPELATPYLRHALRTEGQAAALKDEQTGLADLVLCNSEFVRRTFVEAGVPADRVQAVPNPFPPVQPFVARRRDRVVFLHAGTLSVRKGTHLLLRAWERLRGRAGAELWLVGGSELPPRTLQGLPDNVVLRPRVPRSEMGSLFAQSSVLVLPTLAEGRANVILMAMAHGLPVVTTPNSGCDDAISDGANGWIVPAGDVDKLAGRLEACTDQAGQLDAVGRAAAATAAGWQLADFTRRHGEVVRRFLSARGVPCDFPPQVSDPA